MQINIIIAHPLNLPSNLVLPREVTSLSWSCPSPVVSTEECGGWVLGSKHRVELPVACLLPLVPQAWTHHPPHLGLIDIGQACSSVAFRQDRRPPGSQLSDLSPTLLQLYPLDSPGTGQAQAR